MTDRPSLNTEGTSERKVFRRKNLPSGRKNSFKTNGSIESAIPIRKKRRGSKKYKSKKSRSRSRSKSKLRIKSARRKSSEERYLNPLNSNGSNDSPIAQSRVRKRVKSSKRTQKYSLGAKRNVRLSERNISTRQHLNVNNNPRNLIENKNMNPTTFTHHLIYTVLEKKHVKNLYLFVKYGNDKLIKKVATPNSIIQKFNINLLLLIILKLAVPSLGVFFLPVDLDPARYLKIGQFFLLLSVLIVKFVHFLIDSYPGNSILENRAGQVTSQCESISILVYMIWSMILVGVVVYNSFSKIERRNKFFKGLKQKHLQISNSNPSKSQRIFNSLDSSR